MTYRHCLSNATGLGKVQTEPGEQSKESDDTFTTTDDDSVIKEDTAVLVDEESTTDDLVEDSIAEFQLLTLLPMFQLSNLLLTKRRPASDKGGGGIEVHGMTIFDQEK